MRFRGENAPTEEEKRNGWTEGSLRAYLAERDAAVNGVHRLGVHGHQQPRRVRIDGVAGYDPHEF